MVRLTLEKRHNIKKTADFYMAPFLSRDSLSTLRYTTYLQYS